MLSNPNIAKMICNCNSYLKNSEKSSSEQETRTVSECGLTHGDSAPEDDLSWNPTVRTKLLGDQLRWHLCQEKGQEKDGVSQIVVWQSQYFASLLKGYLIPLVLIFKSLMIVLAVACTRLPRSTWRPKNITQAHRQTPVC